MRRAAARRERGQILVLFGLAAVGLVGLLGLVVDGGNVYVQRRTAQASADAAALAATRALRNAVPGNGASDVSSAFTTPVNTYAAANAFGPAPAVQCAYFVNTSGSPVGNIVNTDCSSAPAGATTAPTACATTSPAATFIPCTASGVHVDVRISVTTYLVGMVGISSLNAEGHATAQVGVLTGFDSANAPLIVCGGGGGNALKLKTQTPAIATSTPGVLAATPASLPAPNLQANDLQGEVLLVTPAAATPPSYVTDTSKDGHIYYLKGQHIGTDSSDCGASGFKGAANPTQPTPVIKNVGDMSADVMWGDTGNSVPSISSRVASSGACAGGTDIDDFEEGDPGCVMILPIASGGGGGNPRPLSVSAWGAFYVWCLNSTGSGCQEIGGQFLANWPIAGGPSASTWTFGAPGGLTTIRLTQ